ncbi:MAG: C39 family peptidase [Lachnospiraceae bacterium]|nr:C39 family peptidase [Lachnospiraceae bacterium]
MVKFGQETSVRIEEMKVKSAERREQKVAEKEAKRLAKEAEKLAKEQAKEEKTSSIDAFDGLADNNPESISSSELLDMDDMILNRSFSSEELLLISQQNGVIITSQDKSRYITVTSTAEDGSPEMRYMLIMDSVDGKYFRPDDVMVYSCAATKLFDSPSMVNAVKTAGQWEAFKRTGINSEGIYQLFTESGQILYANGQYFRRYRENMELTEVITLPGERVELEVNHISQNPSLPNGCEITSLAMVLNFMDFDITKEALSDNYLPKSPIGEANFYEEFVGNPRDSSSYGCYAGAIVNAANSFLASKGSNYKAVDYSGVSFQTVLEKVRQGNPVIVWATCYLDQDPGYSTEWWVDGEYLVWKANLHCMVLIGYDTQTGKVIVQDPMRGKEEYDMELFIKRFKQFYSQAVVVE